MPSFKNAAAFLFAAVAAAQNTITFQSQDNVGRTVYVTANAGLAAIAPVYVAAGASVDVNFVEGWIGNAYAVQDGQPNVPGMLAEVNFNSWGGLTFFDVSAIVNPNDKDNVKEMYPADAPQTPTSGCTVFPCNNCYYAPDDIQTKSTSQTHLIVTLGGNGTAAKRSVENSKSVARAFVIEHY